MIVKCDSDAVVFILHCSFTSVFCLRRECWRLKPSVLLILAMSEVMAVLCRTFADLPFGKSSWSDVFCSCKHPHVLLQIGKVRFANHSRVILAFVLKQFGRKIACKEALFSWGERERRERLRADQEKKEKPPVNIQFA